MSVEKLLLEVSSKKAGLQVIKPPALWGASGVEHMFSFLCMGSSKVAVDIYEDVTEVEVIKTFVKSVDTGVQAHLIWTGERCTTAARNLAEEYAMRLMREEDIESFFESLVMKAQSQAPSKN